jgi:glycosyltransferase involved in cell wall biosynthesis
MKTVCVAVPSGSLVHANFAIALAAMVRDTRDVGFNFLNIKSSNIAISRSTAVEKAQEAGFDYLLFIDSDISFPSDGLKRLLNHAEETGHKIVGCNYVQRQPPFRSLAYGLLNDGTQQEVQGFVQVRRLPTGFLLINMKVFEQLVPPYFRFGFQEKTDILPACITGEDYWFCDKMFELGIEMWMDTDLSMNLIHWGDRGVQWSGNEKGYEFYTDQGIEPGS